MGLTIMKFGAAALGDASQLREMANVVRAASEGGERIVVVCTALAGITDALISAVRAAADGSDTQAEFARRELWSRHRILAEKLVSDEWEREALFRQWAELLKILDRYTRAIATLGELPPRSVDMIAALGERFMAVLVAVVLRAHGVAAQMVEATDLIVTNNHFGNAQPDIETSYSRTRSRLQALLKARIVPVVAGYIGATADGVVTTLGRGGGDYSAALIASALGAHAVCLWTDVDGILTADPKIVADARTLSELSYAEAADIAALGAELLHPHTLAPLMSQNIVLHIRNLRAPESLGTSVVAEPQPTNRIARTIISARGMSQLTIATELHKDLFEGARMRLLSANVEIISFAYKPNDRHVVLVVRASDADFTRECMSHIVAQAQKDAEQPGITILSPLALVALIGSHAELMPRTLLALGRARAHILQLIATAEHILILLYESDLERTVQLLHQELGLG